MARTQLWPSLSVTLSSSMVSFLPKDSTWSMTTTVSNPVCLAWVCLLFFSAEGTSEVFTFEKNLMSCTHTQPIYAWLCPGTHRNKISWSRKAASGSFIGSTGSCLVTKLCPTLWDSMDSSPPGFSVCGVLQARILEWVVISFARGSSRLRDRTCVSCIGRGILYDCTPREALNWK